MEKITVYMMEKKEHLFAIASFHHFVEDDGNLC